MPKRKPKKRKPRTRRRAVIATQPNAIPFPKVRVEWIDIVSDSGWADEKKFNKMTAATPVNEGWVFSRDDKAIKLFASYDREEDGTFAYGDRTMIPKACIKKIIKIN